MRVLPVLALVVLGCGGRSGQAAATASPVGASPVGASPALASPATSYPTLVPQSSMHWSRAQAMREAARYLLRHLSAQGRFDYLRRRNASKKKYNILRHAGAIRALLQYQHEVPSQEIKNAILRASRYLRTRYVQTLPKRPGLLAAISMPGEESVREPTAKLGGTALALIALCQAHRLDKSIASVDELQAMGRFLLFMQRADGSFHSKYVVGDTFDTGFESLYYPGEAMLALTELYDIDHDSRWLQAALKSASQLVDKRSHIADWPADHWMMIAGGPLLERYDKVEDPTLRREELRKHLLVMADKIMATQSPEGFFVGKPRSAPAATRLEGLAAVARIVAREGGKPSTRLKRSLASGVAFLLRCQERSGRANRGGVPRHCGSEAASERRGLEIRIDYVQHFLSALITAPL